MYIIIIIIMMLLLGDRQLIPNSRSTVSSLVMNDYESCIMFFYFNISGLFDSFYSFILWSKCVVIWERLFMYLFCKLGGSWVGG